MTWSPRNRPTEDEEEDGDGDGALGSQSGEGPSSSGSPAATHQQALEADAAAQKQLQQRKSLARERCGIWSIADTLGEQVVSSREEENKNQQNGQAETDGREQFSNNHRQQHQQVGAEKMGGKGRESMLCIFRKKLAQRRLATPPPATAIPSIRSWDQWPMGSCPCWTAFSRQGCCPRSWPSAWDCRRAQVLSLSLPCQCQGTHLPFHSRSALFAGLGHAATSAATTTAASASSSAPSSAAAEPVRAVGPAPGNGQLPATNGQGRSLPSNGTG
jgi:hypothetical protein